MYIYIYICSPTRHYVHSTRWQLCTPGQSILTIWDVDSCHPLLPSTFPPPSLSSLPSLLPRHLFHFHPIFPVHILLDLRIWLLSVYICLCLSSSVCVYVCISVCIRSSVFLCVSVCIFLRVSLCISVWLSSCVCL